MPSPTPEEIKVLAAVSSQIAASHSAPIWLGDRPDITDPADLLFATAGLVTIKGRHFAVTCNHVIDAFLERRRAHPASVFGIAGYSVDLDVSLVTTNEQLDLAVIDLSQYVVRGLLPADRFHQPACWPVPPVRVGDFVFYAGFPGVWVEQPGLAHLRFNALSAISEVHSTADTHLYARLEFEKCEVAGDPGRRVQDLGGLSGAPVFTWRQLHADLVGFIVEYQANYDLLFIRRSHVLDLSGTVALS